MPVLLGTDPHLGAVSEWRGINPRDLRILYRDWYEMGIYLDSLKPYDPVVLKNAVYGLDHFTGEWIEVPEGTQIVLLGRLGRGEWSARSIDQETGLPKAFFAVHQDSVVLPSDEFD